MPVTKEEIAASLGAYGVVFIRLVRDASGAEVDQAIMDPRDVLFYSRAGKDGGYSIPVWSGPAFEAAEAMRAHELPGRAHEASGRQVQPHGEHQLQPTRQLIEIGYWCVVEDPSSHLNSGEYAGLPWPGDLQRDIDPDLPPHLQVIRHLKSGERGTYVGGKFRPGDSWRGFAGCRLCGAQLSTTDSTDGVYVWPTGLEHYVSEHRVYLGHEFCANVVSRVSLI